MLVLDVIVPGEPVGAPRPRARILGSPNAPIRTAKISMYMPGEYETAIMGAATLMRVAWRGQAAETGPMVVEVEAVSSRPQRLMRKKDPTGRIPWVSKPDADNTAKTYLDALVKAGVLDDDAIVCDLHVFKEYAAIGEDPHVRVMVFRWTPRED